MGDLKLSLHYAKKIHLKCIIVHLHYDDQFFMRELHSKIDQPSMLHLFHSVLIGIFSMCATSDLYGQENK